MSLLTPAATNRPLKTALKQALHRLAPEWAAGFFAARARAHAQRCFRQWGCLELNRRIAAQQGSVVQSGPFAGLKLSPETFREHLGPYLLGVYESELHRIWSEVFASSFTQFLDIGAKFGYYAAGLAKHFPNTPVIAFDTDSWARKAIREMCELNDVQNVAVRGYCSPASLHAELRPGAFVLSDCEGYESVLFSHCVGELATAELLVELHEQFSPGVTERISTAFRGTHRQTIIQSEPRGAGPASLSGFSEADRALTLNEFRSHDQSWLWLVPVQGRKD